MAVLRKPPLSLLPTVDEKAAMTAAASPDASNPFATIADVGGGSLSLEVRTEDPVDPEDGRIWLRNDL